MCPEGWCLEQGPAELWEHKTERPRPWCYSGSLRLGHEFKVRGEAVGERWKGSPVSTCRLLRLLQLGRLPSPSHLHKRHFAGSGVLYGSEVHLYPPSLTCCSCCCRSAHPALGPGDSAPDLEPLRPVLPLVRQVTTDKSFIFSVLVLSLEEWKLVLLRNNSRNGGTSPL